MNEWRPIETAPHDVRIILFVNNEIRIGKWYDDDGEYVHKSFKPTHWQPLPEPPKEIL